MRLAQLKEITYIDSEIVELHEKLQSLYEQRADLTSTKTSGASVSLQAIDDSVDLSSIDLSL